MTTRLPCFKELLLIVRFVLAAVLIGLLGGRCGGAEESVYRLKFNDVLSDANNSIDFAIALHQNSAGTIFIGTKSGLKVTDGYHFRHYKHSSIDENSLSANWITDLEDDGEEGLWIGTKQGLNYFEYSTGRFVRYLEGDDKSSSFINDYIQKVVIGPNGKIWVLTRKELGFYDRNLDRFERVWNVSSISDDHSISLTDAVFDRKGRIWVSTDLEGVIRFDPSNGDIRRYSKPEEISAGSIDCLIIDREDRIFCGFSNANIHGVVGNGIAYYNEEHDRFEDFKLGGEHFNQNVSTLYLDRENILWAGTIKGELFRVEIESQKVGLAYKVKPSEEGAYVTSILEDHSGVLWFGRQFAALKVANLNSQFYRSWQSDDSVIGGLPNNHITSIYVDSDDILWIGTFRGLVCYDLGKELYVDILDRDENSYRVFTERISAMYEDSYGVFWIGLFEKGVLRVDRKRGVVDRIYNSDTGNPNSISSDRIESIFEDSKGDLWFGMRGGLDRYDRGRDQFENYPISNNSDIGKSENHVLDILEDRKGQLWLATDKGVCRISADRKIMDRYVNEPNRLSYNKTRCLLEDSKGDVWVGTRGGLNRFREGTQDFVHYLVDDDVSISVVLGILEDSSGKIWLSTSGGLCRLNRETGDYKIYDKNAGLLNSYFEIHAYHKSKSGDFYFGGMAGLDSFRPEELKDLGGEPNIGFFSIHVFGEEVYSWNQLKNIDQVELSSSKNYMSIEFGLLDFVNPSKNTHSYKLEGFDEEWNFAESHNHASYTNLEPGEYVFRVKGANSAGRESAGDYSLAIVITPRFWQTDWFRGILVLLGVLVLWVVNQSIVASTLKSKNAELLDAKKNLESASKAKTQFLANIGHEVRTPLNGVIGTISLLRATDLTKEQIEYTDVAESSTHSLLDVLNDILDFSKIEVGRMKLHDDVIDLKEFVSNLIGMVKGYSKNGEVKIGYDIDSNIPKEIIGDAVRIRQILLNLLTNAVKFTYKGSVDLRLTLKDEDGDRLTIRFAVHDTGIGIPKQQLQSVFEAFSQVDDSNTRNQGGTGLGLAISKQLVEMMDGHVG